jgi:hypothetical protein
MNTLILVFTVWCGSCAVIVAAWACVGLSGAFRDPPAPEVSARDDDAVPSPRATWVIMRDPPAALPRADD